MFPGMSRQDFRRYGKEAVDYIADYMKTIQKRRVVPAIEPGYLKNLIPSEAPSRGEPWEKVMDDFEKFIMPGPVTLIHPILANMIGDALGCVGFSWASCPAMTELELIMLHWFGKMIGLPKEFLPLTEGGKGGGVIQGSASECNFVSLLAARFEVMKELRQRFPFVEEGLLLSKLIAYCSKEAHSSVEKACMIGMVKLRILETDSKFRLRGDEDRNLGLIPFFVSTTLGTTSCCSFDMLSEIGPVCQENDLWLHVDAAYAGSAMICPEFRHLMNGIEYAMSFNTNPNKWMLVNFDCSTMWVRDRFKLTQALVVDPLYLQHSWMDKSIDYRHWGIPLSRRFRSLKLWFVIRTYGVEGLQNYIREHVRLAKRMELLLRSDPVFEIVGEVIMGLVCFRMRGSDERNQQLLTRLNSSGRIHMVPASLNDRFVIRFCVCAENASENDIDTAYSIISQTAQHILHEGTALPIVEDKEAEQLEEMGIDADASSRIEADVARDSQLSKEEMIAQKRNETLAKRRSFLVRMVSDPKCYNPKIVRHLNMANHRKMSQDVYRDRTLMQTISHSQRPGLLSHSPGSGGSGSMSTNFNYDDDCENMTVALSQTGLQTPL
ncbi:pyridoxal-dependent decarboxylase domain protein [Cooperia oncophora]